MPRSARELMKADPITLLPEMSFLQVQHLFVVAQIGSAPVVDERGSVRGVISSSDLLRAVDQACDEDLDHGEAAGPPGTATLAERLASLTAIDLATPDVVWVAPETPIAAVAKLMRAEGIHQVLVGEEGRLAGILTTFDLLEALEAVEE